MERGGVRELDLRKCTPGSVAQRVGCVLPGLRSSAAFFTCLRANLVLSPSALSNFNTPYLEPFSPLPPRSKPSPCPRVLVANEPLVSFHDIPTLSLDALESQDAKSEGLRLIADSVSEMRPRAAKAVVFHPLCLAAMAASWLALHRLVYASDPEKDAARALMLASGITMLYVAAVRFVSCGYVKLADRIGLDWLRAEYGGERDVILGARVGDSLVGALVLRLESKGPAAASPKRKSRSRSRCRSRSVSLKGGKGIIRAWTVAPKHRGQGVGRDLLNEAVRLTRDRCGKDAQVGFAQQHAHSVMIMPSMFNKSFRRDEARAAKALDVAVAEWDVTRKKKR